MSKFVIEPHFRLQEWVAEEKGYYQQEGLDYEFRELIRSSGGPTTIPPAKLRAPFRASRKVESRTSPAPVTGR